MSIQPGNGPVSLGEHEHLRDLPDSQRYRIAMELLLSLGLHAEALYVQTQVDRAEWDRRGERLKSSEDPGVPADVVVARLRERYSTKQPT